MAKLKVLLLEDNRFLRDGTAALLNKQKGIRAVPSSSSSSALEKARRLAPDVVLLDVGPRSDRSLKVLEALKKQHPRAEVIVMDLIPAHTDVVKNVIAGVSSVVSRSAAVDELLRIIRSVGARAKSPPPPTVESLFTQLVVRAMDEEAAGQRIATVKFTKWEQDVICRLAQGKSVVAISRAHEVSISVVKGCIHKILDKLALHVLRDLASSDRGRTASSTGLDPVRKRRSQRRLTK